jgi:hypothetical protein
MDVRCCVFFNTFKIMKNQQKACDENSDWYFEQIIRVMMVIRVVILRNVTY